VKRVEQQWHQTYVLRERSLFCTSNSEKKAEIPKIDLQRHGEDWKMGHQGRPAKTRRTSKDPALNQKITLNQQRPKAKSALNDGTK